MPHKPAPPLRRTASLRKTLGELQQGVGLAGLAITFVTLGGQAAMVKALQLDEAASLIQMFCRTAPLTVAFAFITGLVLDVADDESRWPWTLVWSAVILWISTFVGSIFGGLKVEPADVVADRAINPVLKAVFYLINMGTGYYRAYGDAAFWSSLILGVLLFWVCGVFVRYVEAPSSSQQASETARNEPVRRNIRGRHRAVPKAPGASPGDPPGRPGDV
jgi:hypothetical protein